jgi:hypothetical protein
MTITMVQRSSYATPLTVRRALEDADHLLLVAESHATMLQELGQIDLPEAARGNAMQLRAIASLYLASSLEAAGLIQAADDLTRLARTGALDRDLGSAAPLIEAFWESRDHRPAIEERSALFGRLFGMPSGAEDASSGVNGQFEELLLDLCDAIMKAADGAGQGRVRTAAIALAENVASASNDMLQMLARSILESLSQAIAILNHADTRAALSARTMWDAVTAIDKRFRRIPRPTLAHLRRGRAGMAVLAWLADHVETIDSIVGPLIKSDDAIVDSAIDWVDETLGLVRGEQDGGNAVTAPPTDQRSPVPAGVTWSDLGR